MAKWKDLEAQGIKRCCAYVGGKLCKGRAVEVPSDSPAWGMCSRHAPTFVAVAEWSAAAVASTLADEEA